MSPVQDAATPTPRELVLAAASGLAALVAVTAAAVLGSETTTLVADSNSRQTVLYALALAALGARSALAWRRGLRVAAAVTVTAALAGSYANAPHGGTPVTSLGAGLTGLVVVGLALAGVEYGARNPGEAGRTLTTRSAKRAAVLGAAHTVFVFALNAWLGFSTAYFYTSSNTALTVWTAVGAFLLGTAVAWCWLRHRLVLPAVTTASILAWSLVETLPYAPRFSEMGYTAVGLTPFSRYRWGWFAVLLAAAIAAGTEYGVRGRLSA
jgi:hypothetical protein